MAQPLATQKMPGLLAVAHRARVSTATVSRVLNGSPSAALKTRERVLKAASELGYVPDPRFRLLGQRRSNNPARTGNIGILLQAISEQHLLADSFYLRLFRSLEEEARRNDRHLIISTIDQERDAYLPAFIRDMKVDGVIVVSQCDGALVERIAKLVPVVLVNGRDDSGCACAMMPDNAGGVARGLRYLQELGHEAVVFFDVMDAVPANLHHAERRTAFADALQRQPLPRSRLVALEGRQGTLEETAAIQLRCWQEAGTLPTAIFCADDHAALAFVRAAPACGLRVPQDLSILGFDDLAFDEFITPRLSSLRQPMTAMGRSGIGKLLALLEGRTLAGSEERFPLELIPRDSCGPARSQ